MKFRPLNDLTHIVIHHTATSEDKTVQDIRDIHMYGGEEMGDVGYHKLIKKLSSGKWVPKDGRDVHYRGGHTIPDKDEWLGTDPNTFGLGISIIGNFKDTPPTSECIDALADAVKRLAKRYNIKLSRTWIVGHNEFTYTSCPGKDTMELLYKKLGI